MKIKLITLLVLGALLHGHAHAGPEKQIYTTTINGTKRAYKIYTPTGYDHDASTKYPVVFLLHGDSCAPEILAEAISLFDKKADDLDKFILVLPQAMYNERAEKLGTLPPRGLYLLEADGIDISWSLDSKAIVDGELSFLKALHGIVSRDFKTDPDRFYMAGHSRGALLTQYAAMRLNYEFAAFASIAGPETTLCASPRVLNNWRPRYRVPILLINANADDRVPFLKSWVNRPVGPDVIVQNFADWIDVNHRKSDPTAKWSKIDTVDESSDTTHNGPNLWAGKYVYCNGYVQFYIIDGGGHHWHKPLGFTYGTDFPIETLCKDINTTDVVWDFFKNRRKSDNGTIPKP